MDDLAIGRLLRELRTRRGWRAADVALRAGILAAAYSRIEHGLLETVPVGKLRRVAAVLEVRLVLEPRWRGAAVDRVMSSRHASMTEAAARMLVDAGWDVRPEVSFNHFGERGVVDLVAWHAELRVFLLVELKTELADINELLAVADRRRRLASLIAAPLGWQQPARVAQWLVLAEGKTNRRRLAEHATALRSAFPADGRVIRGWLRRPAQELSALWFLPDFHGASGRTSRSPVHRVRASRSRTPAA